MSSILDYRRYRVKTSLPEAESRQLVDGYIGRTLAVTTELKNNRHNFVARVDDSSPHGLVLKIPRKRNKRTWERLMTLFRNGEALRVFDSHCRLQQLGFHCPDPVLAAEKRRYGMVTDSFILYRYLPGTPASSGDAAAVSSELMALHEKGYTRGDPKAINFLVSDGQVAFIDFKLSRPRLFRQHNFRMEYAHFLHTMPEGLRYLSAEEQQATAFRFAVWLRRTISDLKRKKRVWREKPAWAPAPLRKYKAPILIVGALLLYAWGTTG